MQRHVLLLVGTAAGCLLLAGCDGIRLAESKDASSRIFYEQNGQLVETTYTLNRLQRDVADIYGDVELIGNERLEFGREWEAEFRVIGQDRLLLERVSLRSPRIKEKWRQRGHHYRNASMPSHEFQPQDFLRQLQDNVTPIKW